MKKKVAVFLLTVTLAAAAVFALTACGTNGSPEDVAKAAITATYKYDIDKMLDCMYFEDDADKDAAREALEDTFGNIKVSGSVSDFKFDVEKEYTEEEIADFQAESGIKATVTAVQDINVSFSYDLKGTMTQGDEERTQEMKGSDDATVTVFEVDGKWYVEM